MSSTPTGDAPGSPDKEPWAAILCPHALLSIEKAAAESTFNEIVAEPLSRELVDRFARYIFRQESVPPDNSQEFIASPPATTLKLAKVGLKLAFASLAAFLQANVTGPVLADAHSFEVIFLEHFAPLTKSGENATSSQNTIENLRLRCQRSLDTDGVSPYPHIPYIELFCLARFLLVTGDVLPSAHSVPSSRHLSWLRLRVNLWHYKLLTQPSLGPSSLYTKSGRWTDVVTLEESIQTSLVEAETALFETGAEGDTIKDSPWPFESQILFRLEEANCHILLGNDTKARQALQDATRLRGFIYALSGALGKRTRFQENSFSQLVVLAKSLQLSSEPTEGQGEKETAPSALLLNDDTLLEKIQFNKDEPSQSGSSLPIELQEIKPDDQPKLHPVDQIILLTEATIKDTFSPSDSLTLEEILPYAVRVIDDESVNWQIYTQALLVRSRIELNRSRTVERGVLQMQAVADQVIADTQDHSPSTTAQQQDSAPDVPEILVTSDGDPTTHVNNKKPTSFLPAPKSSESATPEERLRYVNALASPPRWHLESELAYAWTSVGSLVSALEIFKRLRLWPEVALCLATAAASNDGSGRGAGGEEKARAIVRWRLFKRSTDSPDHLDNEDKIDLDSIKPSYFYGPERSPPPPNAPRLFCILGDMENDANHYTRAWEISNRRFARAQKSLGELHLQGKEWDKARQAYQQAVSVNRLSPELWNRLGDIELRLGHFPDAAEAFQRGIATANEKVGGEDARTWSNLGTAYLSWYREVLAEAKARKAKVDADGEIDGTSDMVSTKRAAELGRSASQLLQDSLSAFKRGATIANSNWRIWDNVITLGASLKPTPALDDIILGVKNIIRIRKTESALDTEILTLLVREVTKNPVDGDNNTEIHDPPRGTLEYKVISLFEMEIVPLITSSSSCWDLTSRLRAWRRDFAGALDAAEKAWRAAVGGGVGSTLSASSGGSQEANWLTDAEQWDVVVQRTSDLVAAYENYGPRIEGVGDRWKGKARSAVRSVMGKAKESWEGDERWGILKDMMDGLR